MYLFNMTAEKIAEKYFRDREAIDNFSNHRLVETAKRLRKTKDKDFPVATHFSWKNSQSDEYNVIMVLTSRKAMLAGQVFMVVLAITGDSNGRPCPMFVTDSGRVFIYTPHFFERYAERSMGKKIENPDDRQKTVNMYFSNNYSSHYQLHETIYNHRLAWQRLVPDGMELIQMDEYGRYVVETYITKQQMHRMQQHIDAQEMPLNTAFNVIAHDAEATRDMQQAMIKANMPTTRTFGNLRMKMPKSDFQRNYERFMATRDCYDKAAKRYHDWIERTKERNKQNQ